MGKVEDFSLDDFEPSDNEDEYFDEIKPIKYKGEMTAEFQKFNKAQQRLIYRIFDDTKRDLTRTNFKIQGYLCFIQWDTSNYHKSPQLPQIAPLYGKVIVR